MVNTQYLDDLIKSKGFKKDFIAEKLGISRQSLHNKITNNREFTGLEIKKLCEILGITNWKEINAIFFAEYVH